MYDSGVVRVARYLVTIPRKVRVMRAQVQWGLERCRDLSYIASEGAREQLKG